MAKCENCFLDLSFYPPLSGGACSNCGKISTIYEHAKLNTDIPPLKKEEQLNQYTSQKLQSGFFPFPLIKSIKQLLMRPTQFFSEYIDYFKNNIGVSAALAFAVVCQWISDLFSFIWKTVFGTFIENHLQEYIQILSKLNGQNSVSSLQHFESTSNRSFDFLFGAGTIVLSPFFTLIKIFIFSIMIHIGVKIFIKNNKDFPHSFNTTLKILCFGTAASLLKVIPFIGFLAAMILTFVIEYTGLKEVYKTTSGRSTLTLLFPAILFFVFVLIMVAFAALIGFSFFSLLNQQ